MQQQLRPNTVHHQVAQPRTDIQSQNLGPQPQQQQNQLVQQVPSKSKPFFDSDYLLRQIAQESVNSVNEIQKPPSQTAMVSIPKPFVQDQQQTTPENPFIPYVKTGDLFLAQALEAWMKSMALKPEVVQQLRNENANRISKNMKSNINEQPQVSQPDQRTNTVVNSNPEMPQRAHFQSNVNSRTMQLNPATSIDRAAPHQTDGFGLPREHVYGNQHSQPINNARESLQEQQQHVFQQQQQLHQQQQQRLLQQQQHLRQQQQLQLQRQRELEQQQLQRQQQEELQRQRQLDQLQMQQQRLQQQRLQQLQQLQMQQQSQQMANRAGATNQMNAPNSFTNTQHTQPQQQQNAPTSERSNTLNSNTNTGMVKSNPTSSEQQLPLANIMGFSNMFPDDSNVRNMNLNLVTKQFNIQPNIITDTGINMIPARTIQEMESHWSSRANNSIKLPSGHVPYFMKPGTVEQTTQYPIQRPITTPMPQNPHFMYPAYPTVRPPLRYTTSTVPTVPPTADPNPPAIFDIKVLQTFMPMPKREDTTKPTNADSQDNTATGTNSVEDLKGFDKRCTGCVFVNDRCLLPDVTHCSMFIECVKQGHIVRAFNRECALGAFFDRKSFLCVDPKNTDCPQDRCREPGLKWYPIHGHCKHYWSCASREGGGIFAQSECCPDMGGFVEGAGCVENPNCTESCDSHVTPAPSKGCRLRKTASPTIYFDGNANIERPCAPGTLFNEQQCTCVQDVSVERSNTRPGAGECLPMLSLPFANGSVSDASNNKQHVGNEGVVTTNQGEGIFNGASRLVLWRYANLMFPVVFAVRFRFFSSYGGPRYQTVLSNCNPKSGRPPTFEITLDTLYHEVIFKVDTLKGPQQVFKQIYTHTDWTSVVLIYDGERIVGSVDNRARNIIAAGGIETRPTPFSIGACGEQKGLKGLLDDLSIYEDCIPDDMYGIFMSVLE